VVGNPPYLSMEDMKGEDRNYYYATINHSKIYKTATQKSNLYALFWEKGLSLLSVDSYMSYISPYSWLSNSSFEELREIFLSQTTVLHIMLFPLGVFEAGIDTSITVVKKSVNIETQTVVSDLRGRELTELPHSLNIITREISTSSFAQNEDKVFNIEWNVKNGQIYFKCDRHSDRLEEICLVDRGADTANNKKYTGKEFIPSLNPKPLLIGEQFARYKSWWEGWYIYYLPNQMIREKATARPGESSRFETPEKLILYRFLSEDRRFICVYDDQSFYSLGSTYVIRLKQSIYDLRYILSLINSQLLAFYNSNLFAGVKITRTELLRLPIRRITFTTPPDERERLREKGRLLYERFCQKDDYACVLGFVDHHLPQLPNGTPDTANEQSDVVHDLLAFLAEQMIDLNKQRQTAVEDFVLDLEGVLSPTDLQKIGRLWTPPKTPDDLERATRASPLQGPLATRRLDLRDDIGLINEEQWKWLLKRRLKKIDSLSSLVRVYRQRQPGIATLDKRIAATDQLIDQIVYRLYDLTEDEIAVVEGKQRIDSEE
jgi:hypothetical protein